jgi:DMSO/TMAO reductase YedYZ molybdopterin-dependent catalytic subunit
MDQDQDQKQNKQQKIIQARMRLRERFLKQSENTPSVSDQKPLGTGPLNRHHMPSIPKGQILTEKWPVLDLGLTPDVSRDLWHLKVDGAVKQEILLNFQDLLSLEQTVDISDFHCVTTWSKLNMRWKGVKVSDVLALAEPLEQAHYAMCYGFDGYSTNVRMEELIKSDVLLVYEYEDQPLVAEHGGPVRMITPQLYAWKGSKWISRIELMTEDRPGFWEKQGYSMTAYPWRNDRYAPGIDKGYG